MKHILNQAGIQRRRRKPCLGKKIAPSTTHPRHLHNKSDENCNIYIITTPDISPNTSICINIAKHNATTPHQKCISRRNPCFCVNCQKNGWAWSHIRKKMERGGGSPKRREKHQQYLKKLWEGTKRGYANFEDNVPQILG